MNFRAASRLLRSKQPMRLSILIFVWRDNFCMKVNLTKVKMLKEVSPAARSEKQMTRRTAFRISVYISCVHL